MSDNPLFPTNTDSTDLVESNQNSANTQPSTNPAADLIRAKLERLYAEAPSAETEIKEVEATHTRSKHQQYMYKLSTSGMSLAEIQLKWHEYYSALPDHEKHEVWQEFYTANDSIAKIAQPRPSTNTTPYLQLPPEDSQKNTGALMSDHKQSEIFVSKDDETNPKKKGKIRHRSKPIDKSTPSEIKHRIRDKVSAGGKLKAKHHFQSLLFGLGIGAIVLFIFLFGFFNEVIIAPFIQPGRNTGPTPIIVDPASVTVGSTPQIIIPKINLEIPIDFSVTSTDESGIENALENGIVHYPTTVMPGQTGNAAFFGHSSNNIFNKGKYKFAFVLLHKLEVGDIFYITSGGKVYIYKVSGKTIVDPSEVSVLNDIPGKAATATLITCDPPGTSLHRLVVVGDQISPATTTNSTGENTTIASSNTTQLPGNGPTLLGRLWRWLF